MLPGLVGLCKPFSPGLQQRIAIDEPAKMGNFVSFANGQTWLCYKSSGCCAAGLASFIQFRFNFCHCLFIQFVEEHKND